MNGITHPLEQELQEGQIESNIQNGKKGSSCLSRYKKEDILKNARK